MLASQDFGRRHHDALKTAFSQVDHGQKRHHSLAGADIALHQTVHTVSGAQISAYILQGADLCAG